MIRERTDEQVVTSAAQIDAALDAGMPAATLATLLLARNSWRAGDGIEPTLALREALAHPAAGRWDAVFVAAARRELSPLPPNVR